MPCLTCQSWNVKSTPPDMRKHGLAFCDQGKRWEYLPPHATCPRFSPLDAELTASRLKWDAQRMKK